MSKFFKLVALVVCGAFLFAGTSYAGVDISWDIDIGIEIEPDVTLDITVIDIATGGVATSISFPGADSVPDFTDSWRVAGEYLDVEYSSNYGSWGVRIVGDNAALLNSIISPNEVQYTNDEANAYFAGLEMDIDPVDGVADTLGYAGLVRTDVDDINDCAWANPSNRVALGYTVQVDPSGLGVSPAVPTCTETDDGDGDYYLEDVSIGGYGELWGYIGDKTLYAVGDAGGTNIFDNSIFLYNDGNNNIYNDNLVVFGGGQGGGSISSHNPLADYTDGDSDIAVYLAGRFANTDWDDPDVPFIFALGAGDWGTRLMVELMNE